MMMEATTRQMRLCESQRERQARAVTFRHTLLQELEDDYVCQCRQCQCQCQSKGDRDTYEDKQDSSRWSDDGGDSNSGTTCRVIFVPGKGCSWEDNWYCSVAEALVRSRHNNNHNNHRDRYCDCVEMLWHSPDVDLDEAPPVTAESVRLDLAAGGWKARLLLDGVGLPLPLLPPDCNAGGCGDDGCSCSCGGGEEAKVDVLRVDGNGYDVLVGHSQGANAALRVAERRRIRGLVLLSAGYTVRDRVVDRELLQEQHTNWRKITPWDFSAVVANCDFISLIHAEDDLVVPCQETRDLYEGLHKAAAAAARQCIVECTIVPATAGLGHGIVPTCEVVLHNIQKVLLRDRHTRLKHSPDVDGIGWDNPKPNKDAKASTTSRGEREAKVAAEKQGSKRTSSGNPQAYKRREKFLKKCDFSDKEVQQKLQYSIVDFTSTTLLSDVWSAGDLKFKVKQVCTVSPGHPFEGDTKCLEKAHQRQLPCYSFEGGEPLGHTRGFVFIPGCVPEERHSEWMYRCFCEYPQSPYGVTNQQIQHGDLSDVFHNAVKECLSQQANLAPSSSVTTITKKRKRNASSSTTKTKIPSYRLPKDIATACPKLAMLYGLRWATLGYHYDWTNRRYVEERKSVFPIPLTRLACQLVDGVTPAMRSKDLKKVSSQGGGFSAEAGIVNFYRGNSIMGGHLDDLELTMDAPVVSMSFGNTGIFLLGGTTKDVEPIAMYVRSGDVLIMGGSSRVCYHGVPRVLSGTQAPHLARDILEFYYKSRLLKTNGEEMSGKRERKIGFDHLGAIVGLLQDTRININVRQVLPVTLTRVPNHEKE